MTSQQVTSEELAKLISNQNHIPKNLVVILGKVSDELPEILQRTLKSVMEVHYHGLVAPDNGFKVKSGVKYKKIVGKPYLEYPPYAPNFHYIEKYGRTLERFFTALAEFQIENPSATFEIYIVEPDTTCRHVVSGWKCTNMRVSGLQVTPPTRCVKSFPSTSMDDDDVDKSVQISASFSCDVLRGKDVATEIDSKFQEVNLIGK